MPHYIQVDYYDRSQIAQWLKDYMEEFGMTQSEVARQAGVTQGCISNIARGKVLPTAPTLGEIAAVFNLTLTEVLELIN